MVRFVVIALAMVVSPAAAAEEPGRLPALPDDLDVFSLLIKGSYFMLPILLMSLLVVTFVIERLLGLRRSRVLPKGLVLELDRIAQLQGGFDPRRVFVLCERFPSTAARVLQAMLSKVGRPITELEHAAAEASQREAARLYANVRWLNLAAAVTPLMGLLGTVWGMIRAFHDTTQLAVGQNKADYLAEGIYIALVTTLAGLLVAIPAAIFAHYFEGRIQAALLQTDELVLDLMPQLEPYEGRHRFRRSGETQPVPLPAPGPPQHPESPSPRGGRGDAAAASQPART